MSKHPIFIPFATYNQIGGVHSFMQNLQKYLDDIDYGYLSSFEGAIVAFAPITYDIAELDKFKRNGGKFIQRLDGVHYPTKAGAEYKQKNEGMEVVYNSYADFIIFQSEYSRKQVFEVFGEVPKHKYTIILNGADTDAFYPDPDRKPGSEIVFATFNHFRDKYMLEPIIQALDSLVGKFKFTLKVIGPIVDESLKVYLDRPYVEYLGSQDRQQLGQTLRKCDAVLYSALNSPAPNTVFESVTAGLPLVGFDSGAVSEICFFATDLLAKVSDKVIQEYRDFDHLKLAAKIELLVNDYQKWRDIALKNCQLYDFKKTGAAYVKVFDAQLGLAKASAPQNEYDRRYNQNNYRVEASGYEIARWSALKDAIAKKLKNVQVAKVLDYGSGSGLYVDLWKQLFPNAELSFADVSQVGLSKLAEKFPEYKQNLNLIKNDHTNLPTNQFDVIVSVEVMEHVEDLQAYLTEIYRVLKPGGYFIWTTPCGNRFSVEQIYNLITHQIQPTSEGYRRWTWEDPTHLRRLKTSELKPILLNLGYRVVNFKFRAHLFSFLISRVFNGKLANTKLGIKLMEMDYVLFRNLPNGASMIGFAQK